MKTFICLPVAAALLALVQLASAGHFDIAPYLQSGQLVTGGLDHAGHHTPPPINVYGYEFGEDPLDPFNPSDPGVNQAAGVGNLPAAAALRYNVLSSLLYWDGSGVVNFGAPPGDAHIRLQMGSTIRTLTATSGTQPGSLIQTVASNGSVHRHFTTSLYADSVSSNVPGEPGSVAPPDGIYAFSIDLTLTHASETFVSPALWIVFNNGLDEAAHDAAMEHFVPEPTGAAMFVVCGLMLRRRW